jgi:hypothetical protein
LCPGIPEAQILWSMSTISSNSDSFEVSSQPIQLVVKKLVVLMQSLSDPTPFWGGDAPSYHVVLQPIHPVVEVVVMPMQSSTDPTLLLESVKCTKVVTSMKYLADPTLLMGSDASIDYVFNISSSILSEQGGIPLTSNKPPPIPKMVSFYWNDLVELRLLSSTPFQIRVEVN